MSAIIPPAQFGSFDPSVVPNLVTNHQICLEPSICLDSSSLWKEKQQQKQRYVNLVHNTFEELGL